MPEQPGSGFFRKPFVAVSAADAAPGRNDRRLSDVSCGPKQSGLSATYFAPPAWADTTRLTPSAHILLGKRYRIGNQVTRRISEEDL